MAKGLEFIYDDIKLMSSVKQMEERAMAAIEMKIDTGSQELQSYAQTNARWTNRTGEARRRLKCTYSKEKTKYKIKLAHGVKYGVWLELANEKRYSIIPETIQNKGQEVMEDFNNLLEELSGVFNG